jgi:hypothetical protein
VVELGSVDKYYSLGFGHFELLFEVGEFVVFEVAFFSL